MKFKQAYFLLIVYGFLAATAAWAYRPGPDIIRECPKCKTALSQETTMSGNTFGARTWTDGKMLAPMLPDRSWLVKCPNCGTLFWIDEARELGRKYQWDKKGLFGLEPKIPSEADFLNLLAADKLTEEKERYARQQAWWKANDSIREAENAAVEFSPLQEKNLLALIEILDEKDPGQRIAKAEIYRELGRFEACVRLLSQPFDKDHHNEVAAFIRKLSAQKVRTVREIVFEERRK